MKNSKKILDLLDQITWYAQDQDQQLKLNANTKTEDKAGESGMVFHLKSLRELYIGSLEPKVVVEYVKDEEKA